MLSSLFNIRRKRNAECLQHDPVHSVIDEYLRKVSPHDPVHSVIDEYLRKVSQIVRDKYGILLPEGVNDDVSK